MIAEEKGGGSAKGNRLMEEEASKPPPGGTALSTVCLVGVGILIGLGLSDLWPVPTSWVEACRQFIASHS